MIIFYNKKSGDIFGTVNGRVHENVDKEFIKPSNLEVEEVGKYMVPFKIVFHEVEEPIKKWFMINKKTQEVEERVVGMKKVEVPDGMAPDVSFFQLILDFESGKENVLDYRVELDKDKVVGFIKKQN